MRSGSLCFLWDSDSCFHRHLCHVTENTCIHRWSASLEGRLQRLVPVLFSITQRVTEPIVETEWAARRTTRIKPVKRFSTFSGFQRMLRVGPTYSKQVPADCPSPPGDRRGGQRLASENSDPSRSSYRKYVDLNLSPVCSVCCG